MGRQDPVTGGWSGATKFQRQGFWRRDRYIVGPSPAKKSHGKFFSTPDNQIIDLGDNALYSDLGLSCFSKMPDSTITSLAEILAAKCFAARDA